MRGESEELTARWRESINAEQSRMALLLQERRKLGGAVGTAVHRSQRRLSARAIRRGILQQHLPTSEDAAAHAADAPSLAGGAAPPQLPASRLMRQQGLLKYGWVDRCQVTPFLHVTLLVRRVTAGSVDAR